jgi:hypothetical protein
MGSFSIVKASIVFDDDAGFGDGKEDFLIQALVSKSTMETFNEWILPGTARLNIQRLHVGGMTPILNDMCDKFRSIIRANMRRSPLEIGQALKGIQYVTTVDRASRMNQQTLAGILIDHRQHLHGATVGGPIHNKIPRPDVARIRGLHRIAYRRARAPFSVYPPSAREALPVDARAGRAYD